MISDVGLLCPHCQKSLAVITDDGGVLVKARVCVLYPDNGTARWKCSWCKERCLTHPAFLEPGA